MDRRYRGLTRYDGVRFENFDTVEAVPSAIALFVDSKDRLWIGTNDSGLACYENESCDTSYSESEALLSRSIHAICEDGKGRIVLGTTMGMGYVDEDNTLKFLDSAQLKTEYVDELHADADGLVYGRTLSGAIFTLDDELQVRSFYTPDNSDLGEISCITPDPSKP